jgi:integrase
MAVSTKKENLYSLLQSLSPDGMLSVSGIAELHTFMTKESRLKEVVDLAKIKERADDGRCYIYINRKQLIGTDYHDLISKLYDHYFDSRVISLEDLYPQWQLWRRDYTKATDKTIKENTYIWAAYYENTDIVKVPMANLKTIDFIKFFRVMTKDGTITRRRFNDAKSIINSMFYYAIEQELVDRNPLKDINYKQFSYKPENNNPNIYSIEERVQILDYLSDKDDLISLAVQLDFCLVSRIAEIKALKWSDIDLKNRIIRLQRQYLCSQEVNDNLSFEETKYYCVDYVKGKTAQGFRDLPLIPKALEVLDRIKEVNPDSDYLFLQIDNQPITTVTFNRRIKAICKKLNIPYRSSHKIRFCVASLLYKDGIPATVIQGLLGHSTLAMTLHYLRNVTPKDEVFSQVTAVLSKPAYTCIQ